MREKQAVRNAALEEAAKVAITMRRREIGELPINVNAYDFGYAYAKGGNEMSEDIYHAIRALSSARVAEGEITRLKALVAEAAKAWLIRYEDEVRDEAEEAPCKNLVAAVDALVAGEDVHSTELRK